MFPRIALVSLALALSAPGCSSAADPTGDVTAVTEESTYARTDIIDVIIANGSDRRVRYEACPGRWDRKTATGYERFEEIVLCTDEITSVAAGQTVRVAYSLPAGQPTGTYRIVLPVGYDGEVSDTIHTGDFIVE